MSQANSTETKFWQEFIHIYRENPCLWDANCASNNNQSKKELAYGLLVEKLWEVNEMADEETVKKKLGEFRARFRRELRQLLNVANNDKSEEKNYVPPNWCYYYYLTILESQEKFTDENDDEETESDSLDETEISNGVPSKKKSETYEADDSVKIPPWKRKKTESNSDANETVDGIKDDNATFAGYVATKMRSFDPEQTRLAQKLISDIMFMAEKKQLQDNSQIVSGTVKVLAIPKSGMPADKSP